MFIFLNIFFLAAYVQFLLRRNLVNPYFLFWRSDYRSSLTSWPLTIAPNRQAKGQSGDYRRQCCKANTIAKCQQKILSQDVQQTSKKKSIQGSEPRHVSKANRKWSGQLIIWQTPTYAILVEWRYLWWNSDSGSNCLFNLHFCQNSKRRPAAGDAPRQQITTHMNSSKLRQGTVGGRQRAREPIRIEKPTRFGQCSITIPLFSWFCRYVTVPSARAATQWKAEAGPPRNCCSTT